LGQALKHGKPGLGRLPQAHLEFECGLEGSLGLGTQPQAERGEAQSPQPFRIEAVAQGQRLTNQLPGQQALQQILKRPTLNLQQLVGGQGQSGSISGPGRDFRIQLGQHAIHRRGLTLPTQSPGFEAEGETTLLKALHQGGQGTHHGA
jgi:hypothetical protein